MAARGLWVLLGGVALVTGGRSLLTGLDDLGLAWEKPAIELDNNVRFLSAIWAALGLGLWGCVRAPEKQWSRIQLLSVLVFAGGIGRLVAFGVHGLPALPYIAITASELLAPMVLLLVPRPTS